MRYGLIENGAVVKYPFNATDLKLSRKDVSFPDQMTDQALAQWNVLPVLGEAPVVNPGTVAEELSPTLQNGQWQRTFNVRPCNASENAVQAQIVRDMRNAKLAESDWTQLQDSVVDKAAWATYRDALRNIPAQPGFPWNVNWPKVP